MSEDSNKPRAEEESTVTNPPGSATRQAPVGTPPERRGGGTALLALLVALAALAWQGWQWFQEDPGAARETAALSEAQRLQEHLELLEGRLQTLETEHARRGGDLDSLRSRLGDGERINRSLREEVLGLAERAGLLEESVARLAERRLEGQAALRLDEAESLLRMAFERQALFQDRSGAVAALRLADATLAAVESSQLVNLRQTLRREISALEAAPQVDRPALARRLDDLRSLVARLPEPGPAAVDAGAESPAPTLSERLGWALSKVVSVRRMGPEAEFERFPVEVRRASLLLEIELMRANLAAADDPGWQRGSERIAQLLVAGFDDSAVELASARAIAAELGAARLRTTADAPDLTLRELRNLRAMHNLTRGSAAPAPPPAPAAQDQPAVVAGDDDDVEDDADERDDDPEPDEDAA